MPTTSLFAGPLTSVQDAVKQYLMDVVRRAHTNASSATDRIMVWPLVEWLRKTDMRRSAERLTHFLKAVLMQTVQHLTVLLRVMEFKNLLNMQQYHPLQERK